MLNELSRTEMLIGSDAVEKLGNSRVIVFGIGGVGGHAAEALVRSGIGAIDIVDNDIVSITDINRQIIALQSTVGRPKTEVMRERLLDINPGLSVTCHNCFYLPEEAFRFDFGIYDYIVDAVDTVSAKIDIAVRAYNEKIPVISCMGAGNKLDPAMLEVDDIYNTSVCPLAKVMRRELKKRGVGKLKVVYSKELPLKPDFLNRDKEDGTLKRAVPGSTAFVPSAAGLIAAGEVIRDLICEKV